MTLSAWMRAARPIDGGLLVPGRPHRRACDIVFTPAGVRVTGEELVVVLPYDHHGLQGPDGWAITNWTYGRGGLIGTAVTGTGRYAAPIAQMYKRLRTLSTIIDRFGSGTKDAPLDAAHTINVRADADRDALEVLCGVLARRPDWRPQLADPMRVAQFLHDMSVQGHGSVGEKTGFRQRSMDTFMVMKKLGYTHPLGGRPLPDDSRPDADGVIQAILDGVAANRYAQRPDESRVRALVHRYYLDVTPWPFAALLPAGAIRTAQPDSDLSRG